MPTSFNIIIGRVVGVTDGDTITGLGSTSTQYKIRIKGIDALESYQPFDTQSRNVLLGKVFNQAVHVEWEQKDHYGQNLGYIYLEDGWINKGMVEESVAWHYQ